ncbi:MAG: amino acid--[acyl-carrier-protein] ligase [Labilithrix sp.]
MSEQAEKEFLAALLDKRLLVATGVRGVFGRGHVFEDVLQRFDQFVERSVKGDGAEKLHFPPILNRKNLEKSGYLKSFPQLAGTVFAFQGKDAEHMQLLEKLAAGEDWTAYQRATEVVLTPAGCYPVYPTMAGKLPDGGKLIDLWSYCFRHEPSDDPARMQMFRMRELIRLADLESVRKWRAEWIDRGLQMLKDVGLPAYVALANDPFFGRGGRMLAANQREQELKFEIVCPITSEEKPTAIMSFNYHQDHFGTTFGIQTADGNTAQTACLGFGMERIILALFKVHGLDPATWPAAVRAVLYPEAK